MSKLSFKLLFFVQIFQLFFAVNLLFAPVPASAADAQFVPEVPIPGANIKMEKSTKPIADYIQAIYKYAIGAVGIVSAVVLMIGGLIWLTAGGSSERISDAKSWIGSSLMGLIIAILAYSILNTINPALVNFKIKEIQNVENNGQNSTLKIDWNNTVGCGEKINGYECGAKCPTGLICKNAAKNTPGAKECPETINAGTGYYWKCSSLSGENGVCKEDKDCKSGLICNNSGRCKSITLKEGSSCDNGICASGLRCIFDFSTAGGYPGMCYDGSAGDPCCHDSECISENCSRDLLDICEVDDRYDHVCN